MEEGLFAKNLKNGIANPTKRRFKLKRCEYERVNEVFSNNDEDKNDSEMESRFFLFDKR